MATKKPRVDVHAGITATILEQMESAKGLWECPWYRSTAIETPSNAVTGKKYNGLNIVALWGSAHVRGFTSGQWATYKQWQSIGANVRKGEKGSRSVFYRTLIKDAKGSEGASDGEQKTVTIPMVKCSTLFSAEQVDGYEVPAAPVRNSIEALQNVDDLINATGASIAHDGGNRAFYQPATDEIHLPERSVFADTVSYYGTVLHELVHWTGAPKRLDRNKKASYAFEELVAELGAAFLCADLGITATPRQDHAEYLAGWVKELKNDNRAIARAASQASKAAAYLQALAAPAEAEEDVAA